MWNDLLTTALIGTERRALSLDNLPEAFRDLAAQLEGNDAQPHDAERSVLSLAGALTLHRRVGQTAPLDTTSLLDPCDLDDLPPCSPRAGLLLQQILGLSRYAPLLPEWIALAAGRGQRVSEEYLPRFLTALNRSTLPDHFYNVLGKRGRWLAQQNEAWAYAVLPQTDVEWESASLSARAEYLRRLRASNPAHARELVESVWKSENAETRGLFLQTLKIGLSLADEPLLETALDARASSVRPQAASVLTNLDGSAYQQRMIQRANALIHLHWQKTLFGKELAIDLTLPQGCDESMVRDGIDPNPSTDSLLDTRSYWLYRIALVLPLSYWLNGDWSADDLIRAFSALEQNITRTYLESALIHVLQRDRSDSLAQALLENSRMLVGMKATALRAASPQLFEHYVLHALDLERNPGNDGEIFTVLNLSNLPYTWSPAVTRALLNALSRWLPHQSTSKVIEVAAFIPTYVLKMAPAYADNLGALAIVDSKAKALWSNVVRKNAAMLEFRQSMHKEFAR